MLTFGRSAYLWLSASEPVKREVSPAVRRLTLIASGRAHYRDSVVESASMADDWSAAVAPGLIRAVLTDTARPQPERQTQPLGARQNANVGFR